jgi:hypothetical protein
VFGRRTTRLDELIASGPIIAKRSGRLRLVLAVSIDACLEGLPDAREMRSDPAYRVKQTASGTGA